MSKATDSNGGNASAETSPESTQDAEELTDRQIAEQRDAERAAAKEAKKLARRRKRESRPKVKKLRFLLVAGGLTVLAVVSWIFGILMAVASDLPDLEARAQFDRAENSIVMDADGTRLTTLTGNQKRILLESEDISPLMKQAVVSIEDERFYDHRGIDYLGLARALREDILAGAAVQGGSTITQQFVKNALDAQNQRSVLQKLKESALAYQLERNWSKDKILTNYLNNIYFGEGAYGIEAAAKTFFGGNHPGCGEEGEKPCASVLRVDEAAMLAGMISSPSAYDPKTNPRDAEERRNIVLAKMRELGILEVTDEEFEDLKETSAPGATTIEPPREESQAPYFTDWLRQQLVDKYGAGEAFGGGLEVTSTIDLELQRAAQDVVESRTGGLGPTSAVVVIENGTGKVRAMVGGTDFNESPFNLATNGLRQPGSSFKPFTLVTALDKGVSPETVYQSAPQEIPFDAQIRTKKGKLKDVVDIFKVNNYDDNYLGSASVRAATTFSDNAVYAQLGTDIGTDNISEMARDLGINSRVPDNPAMILGGLKRGVTPLEMAYAYSTLSNGGKLISGTMGSRGNGKGPVAIEEVTAKGKPVKDDLGASGQNEITSKEVVSEGVAAQATDILRTVVTSGTGKRAQVGDDVIWGKTGTTDDNIDAWFVGANERITVAVWVGYKDGGVPMLTEFSGGPVDGGTIPTLIFADIVAAFNRLDAAAQAAKDAEKAAKEAAKAAESGTTVAPTTTAPAPAPVEEVPAEPVEPDPAPAPEQEPPPAPAQPPPGNPGGGGDGGAATPRR